MIPKWLSEKDNYIPKEEKDSYIQKSIFSFIKIISIVRQNKNQSKLIYLINPTLKVISTIVNVILISISRSFLYLLIMDIYVLGNLLLMEKKSRKRIFLKSLIFPIISLIALIPSMFYGNIYNSLLLFQKIFITILMMNLLAHNTKWSDVSKSLKILYVPDLFIWIMDITIKYIVLLGEHSINLLYALKLRSVGKASDKYNSITGIVGNLFMKSYKMSEEMSQAMECRGFTGEYTTKISFNLRKADYVYIIVNLIFAVIFLFTYM